VGALEAALVKGLAVNVHLLHRVDLLGAGWAVIVRHLSFFIGDDFIKISKEALYLKLNNLLKIED
jgi:hypothetical protein